MNDDMIDQLDVLHVWPQSVADHHADILTPRQIRQLYDVGRVATEAAAELRTLRAERDAAVQAEVAAMNELNACKDALAQVGEFICGKCGLRQAGNFTPGDF